MAREMLEKILEAERQAEEQLNLARNEAEKIVFDATVTAKEKSKALLEEAQTMYDDAVKKAQVLADELIESKTLEAKDVCSSFSAALEDKKKDCFNAVLSKLVQ